ncbi:MAG: UDP-N-acetylmuramate:L-alanyl-gamma-D-glutamyl-meso-diaminopimelate ligase [Gammaproteobacteria bacterium]|nr:UDP-N-acetylmuramate:L-alanyl-gamma-D-glutamyl-meso-diaminopimelate ligase [Gammaproteobacteria bacterium]
MGGVAALAKEAGFKVSGADEAVYPPMSTQLSALGIDLHEGYEDTLIEPPADQIVIGNALSRGKPVIEAILAKNLPYSSGPQWLHNEILQQRHVIAVSGTHGKTTTASLVAWILEFAGLKPGFLIGGVPENFGISARLGQSEYFVIEADEYDSAFFDKRSKFIHYHPRTLIINNLEFDHADIFSNLADIQKQFQHLLRTIPNNGTLIVPTDDTAISEVLAQGVWTPVVYLGKDFRAETRKDDGSEFVVYYQDKIQGHVSWNLLGQHNIHNALAAIAAAHAVGVPIAVALAALPEFKNVKRRLEKKGESHGISVYDDFAHHPTAIATTLQGLRARVGTARLFALLELGSYTMRTGVHKATLPHSWLEADEIVIIRPTPDWGVDDLIATSTRPVTVLNTLNDIVAHFKSKAKAGDHLVVMSNKGFGGIHQKLLEAL